MITLELPKEAVFFGENNIKLTILKEKKNGAYSTLIIVDSVQKDLHPISICAIYLNETEQLLDQHTVSRKPLNKRDLENVVVIAREIWRPYKEIEKAINRAYLLEESKVLFTLIQ